MTGPGRCCSSPPGSASRRYWRCCISLPPHGANGRCGGSTRPAAPPSTRSPPRLTSSWRHCPTPASTSTTAPPQRTNGTARHATAGRLAEDQLTTIGIPTAASAYICGPPSFMTDMRDALTALSVPAANIHTEQFAALTAINPGLTARPPVTPHQPPGPARKRAPGHLRPQRHHHRIRQPLAQRPGPSRRLRRAHPLGLPRRRLPHLHHPAAVRRLPLRPRTARTPRRRPGTHLLRSAENRPRTGHVGAERHGRQGRDPVGLARRQPGPRPDPGDLRTAVTSAR